MEISWLHQGKQRGVISHLRVISIDIVTNYTKCRSPNSTLWVIENGRHTFKLIQVTTLAAFRHWLLIGCNVLVFSLVLIMDLIHLQSVLEQKLHLLLSWIKDPVLNSARFSYSSITLKDILLTLMCFQDFRMECEIRFICEVQRTLHRDSVKQLWEVNLDYSQAVRGLLNIERVHNQKVGIPFWWIRWAYPQTKYNTFKSLSCLPNRIYVFKSRKETFCFLFKC